MHAWYDQVIALVRELALQFVMTGDGPGATTRVAIVTFASSALTLTPLSGDTNVVLAALEQSLAAGTHGFTNISDGLVAGATALAELAARPSAERVLLLLTDGEQSPQFGGTATAAMQATAATEPCDRCSGWDHLACHCLFPSEVIMVRNMI